MTDNPTTATAITVEELARMGARAAHPEPLTGDNDAWRKRSYDVERTEKRLLAAYRERFPDTVALVPSQVMVGDTAHDRELTKSTQEGAEHLRHVSWVGKVVALIDDVEIETPDGNRYWARMENVERLAPTGARTEEGEGKNDE
jgi:urease gamma subunit